ncbi:MAG: hypothetical protein ACLQOO_18590 [Terriglobia bacterium]
MPLAERESTPARVAASQANGKKSKGPTTPEGKARVFINALKTGAYAKTDRARRELMLRRGENQDDFELLHQEFKEEWQPEYVTEAMLVKTIAEKSFDKAQLRAAWMESQLNSLRIAEVQAQRRQLLALRWLPGLPDVGRGEQPPLWLAKDSPSKFNAIFDILDDLQKWYDTREVSETFGQEMHALYGEHHSRAGERIRTLFIDIFEDDNDAAAKAEAELPKWIAQERSDVEREREVYRKEREIKANAGPNLTEEEVAKKEAALEIKIREHTRLLLQLKTTRSQWREPSEAPETSSDTNKRAPASEPASARASSSQSAIASERGTVDGVPPAKPRGSSSVGPSFGSSGGDSITWESEGAAEGSATEHKTTVDREVAAESEKMGRSNLTSAA